MKIYCVASGSSGNCYVVSDGKNEIMLEAGVNPDKVIRAVGHIPKYALLTHEHDDHAKYSDKFDKYGVNVYCSRGTREAKNLQATVIEKEETYTIGGFAVYPFDADHDAEEPFCYLLESLETGERLLFATDTYYVYKKFGKVTHYLIECNYDEETISEDVDNAHMNRVVESHISLRNLKLYLKKSIDKSAREIYVCHLSSDNLNVAKAVKELKEETGLPVYACKKDGGFYAE